MHRQISIVSQDSERNAPFAQDSSEGSSRSNSEEDELCDIALSRYVPRVSSIHGYLRPFLRSMFQAQPSSTGLLHVVSNSELLRDIRNQRDIGHTSSLNDHDQRVYDMIVRAMHNVVEDKEKELEEKERQLVLKESRIKEKYSGKKTAAIAVTTGAIATIVTTICSTLVALNSK